MKAVLALLLIRSMSHQSNTNEIKTLKFENFTKTQKKVQNEIDYKFWYTSSNLGTETLSNPSVQQMVMANYRVCMDPTKASNERFKETL